MNIMGRIINSESYLRNLLKEGQVYHIGFGLSTLTEDGKKLLGLKDLIDSKTDSFKVTGRKGPLKENTKGKFVREQPESKESIEKHIEYYSTHHKKTISYDRIFHVWKKVLLHKFELSLYKTQSPQGETIIHFPQFKLEDTEGHYLLAKAAMNIANLLGGYFQIFDTYLEPVLPINNHLDRKILGSGFGSVKEQIQEVTERLLNGEYGEVNKTGNSYRFALLQDHNITNIEDGIGGFNEYLRFEFQGDDVVILENLKSGNATYIFKYSLFEKDFMFDKQNAKDHPSFITRVIHHNIEEWERIITKYITKKAETENE